MTQETEDFVVVVPRRKSASGSEEGPVRKMSVKVPKTGEKYY